MVVLVVVVYTCPTLLLPAVGGMHALTDDKVNSTPAVKDGLLS